MNRAAADSLYLPVSKAVYASIVQVQLPNWSCLKMRQKGPGLFLPNFARRLRHFFASVSLRQPTDLKSPQVIANGQ
jgi:hypothetical protein